MNITEKMLYTRVDLICAWLNTDKVYLSGAYGGWRVEIKEKDGGARDLLDTGYISKPNLWLAMTAFLKGYDMRRTPAMRKAARNRLNKMEINQ